MRKETVMSSLKVATCQFPVSASIERNARYVRDLMREASDQGARAVHFSECALSGYAGSDFDAWEGFDWDALRRETEAIRGLAKARRLWVILGSSHRLSAGHLPHNSLYVIGPDGAIVDRYDKRFCTGSDLRRYSPGDHFTVFDIDGVRCGCLICYDVRFPELFREYRKLDVHCLFHSFYNARAEGRNVHTVIMRTSLQTRAATNSFWISGNNSSGHYQSWPSVFVTPDGRIARSLRQHRTGVMINTVDLTVKHYDASGPFREGAMQGILNSGALVSDPRSADRRCL